MKKFTFREYRRSPNEDANEPEDASKTPQNAYLKRREQVRKAQRTHRERKEAYIKSLETEVLQLRTNEAKILQETKTLYAEIVKLKNILSQHGIELPPQADKLAPQPLEENTSFANSAISIRTNGYQKQQLHVQSTHSDSDRQGEDFILSDSSASNPPGRRRFGFFRKRDNAAGAGNNDQSLSETATLTTDAPGISPSANHPVNISDLDVTDIGTEFVLTLESPCLSHTQGNPKEPSAPSGHALTNSAQLLFQAPSAPSLQLDTHAHWETPNSGLERLLELSSNLNLGDEVTPIQAWNYIRQHPSFAGMELDRLRKLTSRLMKEVKCYGFGAVIEQDTFESIVSETLEIEQVF
ncbi:hypothetical protein AOQ84DRAFT_370950 [Glonium stellatum]|uniref:BZIP domain-containing protein n=1 Tax=Glonium stellatum TaxID=574774 RepID=A0A8E2JZE4_9PEZI|nr:hypothetical protein AOQ84DRAFT_370950 [Glonium stellatum]